MKRIALSWAELAAAGVPTALHLNARTDRDYQQWESFIRERPEVGAVAFEFGTGAGVPSRIGWHVERLCALADGVGRPLTLVVRGGSRVTRAISNNGPIWPDGAMASDPAPPSTPAEAADAMSSAVANEPGSRRPPCSIPSRAPAP